MTLKDTISKWHVATCLLEQNQPREAAQRLKEIQNPSAKIVYNLGCISMYMERYTDAMEYFSSSIDQDKYLAISYFQRGICHYKTKSFGSAEKDFDTAKSMIPAEGIDYRQLGAKVILSASVIDGFSRSCKHHTDINMPSPLQSAFLDFVFYPPKKMVANLKKEDFLGKAKVISSVQESDILYAESKGMKDSNPKKNAASGGNSSLSAAKKFQLIPTNSGTRLAVPPSRPPPRLGRSRSMGDLLDDGDEDGNNTNSSTSSSSCVSSSISNSTLTIPMSSNYHLQKRQSTGDYDCTHITQDNTDSFSSYARLSVSSPALDDNNNNNSNKKRPPVPKRPAARPRENTASKSKNVVSDIHIKPQLSPSSPHSRFEFQKIQEALKGKLNEIGHNNNNNNNNKDNNNANTIYSHSGRNLLGIATATATTERQKPFKVNYKPKFQEDLDKLVPPKRILAHSHPNLSQLVTSNYSKAVGPNSNNTQPGSVDHIDSSSNSNKGHFTTRPNRPNKPPVPTPAPRKSPDSTLRSAKPPRPPPPPRKL